MPSTERCRHSTRILVSIPAQRHRSAPRPRRACEKRRGVRRVRWNGLLGPETRRETARKPGGAGRKPPARETGKAAADNPAENPFTGGLETPPLGAGMLPPTGREKGFALPGLTLHRLGTRTKTPENPAEPAANPRPRKRVVRSGQPRRSPNPRRTGNPAAWSHHTPRDRPGKRVSPRRA